MIINVRCITCGEIIGNKYRWYLKEVARIKIEKGYDPNSITYFNDLAGNTGDPNVDPVIDKQPEAIVMDQLGLRSPCCRRHLLTHVDIY